MPQIGGTCPIYQKQGFLLSERRVGDGGGASFKRRETMDYHDRRFAGTCTGEGGVQAQEPRLTSGVQVGRHGA